MAGVGGSTFVEIPSRFVTSRRQKQMNVASGGVGKVETKRLADSAGGYAYRSLSAAANEGRSLVTQNRYVHWKVSGCNLELSEESLDADVVLGDLKVGFADAPILGDGVSVVETASTLTFLVATVASVHRLDFPHPSCLGIVDSFVANPPGSIDARPTLRSVFANATPPGKDAAYLHTLVNANQLICAASWLSSDDQAVFALGTTSSSILLIILPPPGSHSEVTQIELKQSTTISRFWTGLVPSVIRGGDAKEDSGLRSLRLVIHPLGNQCFVIAVCQDHKLRLWSAETEECVLVTDLLSFVPGDKDLSCARKPLMKKSCGPMPSSVFVAVYLRFKLHAQFLVFQPEAGASGHVLHHVATLHCPSWDLIDFALSSHAIWMVATTPEGETVVKYALINGDVPEAGVDDWHSVELASFPLQCLDITTHREPREVYLQTLFAPEHFCPATLMKAIKIYRKSPLDSTMTGVGAATVASLRDEVVAVVENEIHASAADYELAEDEYRDLQLQCWARFYSQWLQYQEAVAEPLAIFADGVSGLVGLIRKNRLSLLRRLDDVDRLSLVSKTTTLDDLFALSASGAVDDRDLVTFARALALIDEAVFPDVAENFINELFLLESPHTITDKILMESILPESSLGGGDSPTPADGYYILSAVGAVRDLPAVADFILNLLDFAKGDPENLSINDIDPAEAFETPFGRFFCGGRGVSTLVASLKHLVGTRLRLLRNILLLLQVAIRTASQIQLRPDHAQTLQVNHIRRASSLIQCYFTLHWVVDCPVIDTSPPPPSQKTATPTIVGVGSRNAPSFADFSLRSPSSPFNVSSSFVHGSFASPANASAAASPGVFAHPLTLAELFFRGTGGHYTRALLTRATTAGSSTWTSIYQPMLTIAAQLLWPYSSNTLFQEFLLSQNLHAELLEHIRLLSSWCEPNAFSRVFMQGQCFLAEGKIERAVDCFLKAAPGVDKEDFLLNRIMAATEEDLPRVDALYFLKILSMLETCGRPDVVVDVADAAIKSLSSSGSEANVSTLWSLLFRHHLDAGHVKDAYEALVANPDPNRRRDCLRQFLIVLTERGQLQPLVNFQYEDLHGDVVQILESRARATDVVQAASYYDLLYAFHVHRENYRQAAIIAYEQSERFAAALAAGGGGGLTGLHSRAKSLLASMNALRLVLPEYRWILAPEFTSDDDDISDESETSQDKLIIELEWMERLYASVHALIQLAVRDRSTAAAVVSGPLPTPTDLVALLMKAGLVDKALGIAQMMSLPLTTIVEPLVAKCIQMSKSPSDPGPLLQVGESLASAPRVAESNASPADVAWNVLVSLLDKFDKPAEDGSGQWHSTRCLRAIFRQVLNDASVSPPHRLVLLYKRRNAAELLKLYLDSDRVEEATTLAVEILDACLGRGKEIFGLDHSLHSSGPAVCAPVTHVDQLRRCLRNSKPGDALRAELLEKLESKIAEYMSALSRCSKDFVTMKRQTRPFPSMEIS